MQGGGIPAGKQGHKYAHFVTTNVVVRNPLRFLSTGDEKGREKNQILDYSVVAHAVKY